MRLWFDVRQDQLGELSADTLHSVPLDLLVKQIQVVNENNLFMHSLSELGPDIGFLLFFWKVKVNAFDTFKTFEGKEGFLDHLEIGNQDEVLLEFSIQEMF